MSGDPKQASSAKMAIGYITGGSLLAVWTAVYYFYHRQVNGAEAPNFWVTGFFLTGLILVTIGLFVGQIGRSARQAEVMAAPTQVVTPAATVTPNANGVPLNAPTAVTASGAPVVGRTQIG